jgi:D-arabinan exo alpha-(1,3)/(1,5)-arabinofuranosidase (non-reducing end)
VTIQALGWKSNGTYLPEEDNISSVAYWYQKEPHNPFPELPPAD